MIYTLKNKGKGKYGLNEGQITADDLVLLETEDTRLKAQILLAAGWVLNAGTGLYEYTFANARITESSEVEFIPHAESEAVVSAAEIKTHTPVSVGQVIIQATNVPGEDIIVDVLIENVQDV